jgi:hypothetical protein
MASSRLRIIWSKGTLASSVPIDRADNFIPRSCFLGVHSI